MAKPIYGKPVRLLMGEEMVQSLGLESGKVFSRRDAVEWFAEHYPLVKPVTVKCHVTRLSVNDAARLHYGVREHDDDVFFKLNRDQYRLYDPTSDPAPVWPTTHVESAPGDSLDDETEVAGASEFALERDLRNYLEKNLGVIEPGLQLYEDEGIRGIEFPVGGRFIDILAVASNGDLVVIELKVSRGYDRVVGQLLRYMAWVRKNLAEKDQAVRGVIVAREISDDLVLATSLTSGVELREYELSLTLKSVGGR